MTATIRSSTQDSQIPSPGPWLVWIIQQQRSCAWSDATFAGKLGLTTSDLDEFLRRIDAGSPSYDDVRLVARALRLPLPVALVAAGLADEDDIGGPPPTVDLLAMFPSPVLSAELDRRMHLAGLQ